MIGKFRLLHRFFRPQSLGGGFQASRLCVRAMSSNCYKFETLQVSSPAEFVTHVELNRPAKRNAMNTAFWGDMVKCFTQLATDPDCRVIVLTGAGKAFCAGLDLTDNDLFVQLMEDTEPSRKAFFIHKAVKEVQESFNVIEKCPKPVIAAVHDACVGGAVDMISACDIRYCTQDAFFEIKEVELALAADVGTLQRFPKIIGNDSLVRELVYTARRFHSDEAKSAGFVSRIFPTKDDMVSGALELARVIAAKSPVAVQGSKVSLVYSRDHSVQDGLDHIRTWNAAMIQSEDIMKALSSYRQKQTPKFSKL